jgi:hypothetical protein
VKRLGLGPRRNPKDGASASILSANKFRLDDHSIGSGSVPRLSCYRWVSKIWCVARHSAYNLGNPNSSFDGSFSTSRQPAVFSKRLCLPYEAPGFTQPHKIADGASEFLVEVLSEPGRHSHSAMLAADLRFGSCLEIELIAEVSGPGV